MAAYSHSPPCWPTLAYGGRVPPPPLFPHLRVPPLSSPLLLPWTLLDPDLNSWPRCGATFPGCLATYAGVEGLTVGWSASSLAGALGAAAPPRCGTRETGHPGAFGRGVLLTLPPPKKKENETSPKPRNTQGHQEGVLGLWGVLWVAVRLLEVSGRTGENW